MPNSKDADTRYPKSRSLRPEAARWVRPDAARFFKPGTRLEDVFPALALKYNPTQPCVPPGNGIESGRWTDGSGVRRCRDRWVTLRSLRAPPRQATCFEFGRRVLGQTTSDWQQVKAIPLPIAED